MKKILILTLTLGIIFTSCTSTKATDTSYHPELAYFDYSKVAMGIMIVNGEEYKFSWGDEFDGNTLDRSKWDLDKSQAGKFKKGNSQFTSFWGNGTDKGQQCEVVNIDMNDSKVSQEKGVLTLSQWREYYGNSKSSYISSAPVLVSRNNSLSYGVYEIRFKVPCRNGVNYHIFLDRFHSSAEPVKLAQISLTELHGTENSYYLGTNLWYEGVLPNGQQLNWIGLTPDERAAEGYEQSKIPGPFPSSKKNKFWDEWHTLTVFLEEDGWQVILDRDIRVNGKEYYSTKLEENGVLNDFELRVQQQGTGEWFIGNRPSDTGIKPYKYKEEPDSYIAIDYIRYYTKQ